MKKDYLIAPSILSADFTKLGEQIQSAERAGADWLHIDVMDGHFVPNISMGPFVVEACRRATSLHLDVHLMIEKPERYLDEFASAGADTITVHIESCSDIQDTLTRIRDLGCQVGVTLNPSTPALDIQPYLTDVDMVLVMTVNPGFSGQSFMPEVLPKIESLRNMLDAVNPRAQIEVDGGISSSTIRDVYARGGRIFVAGSAIFDHKGGIEGGIKALKDQIAQD